MFSPSRGGGLPNRLAILLGGLLLFCLAPPARADRTPSQTYINTFGYFYEGEYKDALDHFLSEGRGAIKTAQSRWIDSICYHTMTAECYFQMGDLPKALEHYTSALRLFVAFSDWMTRVKFQPITQAPATSRAVPWGVSTRQAKLGRVPTEMPIAQGRIDNSDQIKQGGVVQQAMLFPIQVQEIVRCTCLAIRRRAMILGPLSRFDPLTNEVFAALSRRPGPPNHWSECWIDLQLGLATIAAGKEEQAVPLLNRAIVAAGEYDHPLTPTALLQLGLLAMGQSNYAAALKYFEESSYSAAYYNDIGVLEEAFRYAANAHLLSNRKGLFPPLQPAITWAKVKGWRQLQASLNLLAAENLAILGQTTDAERALADARQVIARRRMGAGWIGARLSYLTGLVHYQQRRAAEGDAAIAAALNYLRAGSLWMHQIGLVDTLFTSGQSYITPRIAMDLYRTVLRDPTPADWSTDPLEALAVLSTPHIGPLEHWFEVAIERKEQEMAMEIADRIRRHRFFSTLTLGGRVQALRWVLNAPPEALDKETQLQRQDLLLRWPSYARLNQQVEQLTSQLNAEPPLASTPEAVHQQSQSLQQLAALSAQQEGLLREIAVRREPANLAFPPLHTTQQIQQSLPPGRALLSFLATSRHLYAFLLNNQRYAYWQMGAAAGLQKRIVDLLRQMGNFEGNREMSYKDLADEQWKQPAGQVLEMMLKGSQADFSQRFDELIIVPDSVLWYVPFEALQVTVDKKQVPLISRFRIRYLPTASLVVPNARARKPAARTAVVVGQLFGRDSEPLAREAFEQLARKLPGAVALPPTLPAPSSLYASLFDRLLVLDNIESPESPYAWAPIPLDRGKAGSSLNDWLKLPWKGPDEVILPGYHTAAENALKKATATTAGQEMFLPLCALMASGARTVMLSRWRTGGQINFDFAREFTQELPYMAPSEALQRCVFLAADSPIHTENEPRYKTGSQDKPLKARHPFFWAGYMVVDSTGEAPKDEPPAKPAQDPPVAQAQQPPAAAPQAGDAQPDAAPQAGDAKPDAGPMQVPAETAPAQPPAENAPTQPPASPAPDGAPASRQPAKAVTK